MLTGQEDVEGMKECERQGEKLIRRET